MGRKFLLEGCLDSLEKEGDSTVVDVPLSNQQLASSLYVHGKKVGIKYSYVPLSNGTYRITFAEWRK